jgi:hypothetical protein
MLFPLMDMFFILLLFFLVTSGFSPDPPEEEGTFSSTPNPAMGEAQILLQVVSADSSIWLDNTSFSGSWQGSDLLSRNGVRHDIESLTKRLERFRRMVGQCAGRTILTAMRCPDDLVYSDIDRLQSNLEMAFEQTMGGYELTFGLVPGTADQILIDSISSQDDRIEIRWRNE